MDIIKNVLVPKETVKAIIEFLGGGKKMTKRAIRKHVMTLRSAIGIETKMKCRTLHAIDLYDEQKSGQYYIGRDQEGMLRVYNDNAFYGYISRTSTMKNPHAFHVRLFTNPETELKRTFPRLDLAENYLRKQVAAAQGPTLPRHKAKAPARSGRPKK